MLGPILVIVAIAAGAIALVALVFVLGMRTKSPIVQRPIVWFTKRWINPGRVRAAAQPGSTVSLIRNVGRVSGRAYETPVDVVPAGDAYLIALPYGTNAQWVRNVLAAGSATIVTEGHPTPVDRAELIPMAEVIDAFPPGDRSGFRLLRTDQCLRLRRATA
jgi:deazaflavin-dependent oxidoreductase (nitroreductase family)